MNDLRKRYRALVRGILEREYFTPNQDLQKIMAVLMLIPDGSILLTGNKGTGKSTFVAACSRRFFTEDGEPSLARVNCHQELMDTNVLYRINYADPDAPAVPRDMLRRRFRFIDEIARMSPNLQNAFLSMLSEREVIYEDERFAVPRGVTFFCRNPRDQGQEGLVSALHDRIDVELLIPENSYPPRQLPPAAGEVPLGAQEMLRIWDAVEQVEIDERCWDYAHLLNYYFCSCVVERGTANPLYGLPCDGCARQGEVCRQLRSIPGYRGVQSMFRLARALAWFDGRPAVTISDLETALPCTFAHRLDFHNDVFMNWQDPQLYLRSEFIRGHLDARREIWLSALEAGSRGDFEAILEAAGRTEDLVLGQLYYWKTSGQPGLAA